MAEQVRIDITADDQASPKIDKVADKVDDLDKPVKIPLDADATQAERDISTLLAKVDKLASAPATLLLTSNAATLGREIADLTIELDKLDAEDPTVDVKAEQINALAGDLDKIEAKIKDVNNIPVDIDTKPAVKNIDDIGKSADSSKSVLANAVGNASSDLSALGGVAGSTGVAIGQIGEYASDAMAGGESLTSVLKNMGSVVGPLGALTLITIGLTAIKDNMDKVSETEAFNEDRVKAFADALSDASVTAAELAAALAVEGETGIFVRIENESVNVQKSIENTLGTFEAFNDKVAQGQQGFDGYADSLVKGADAADLTAVQMLHLRDGLKDARDGTLDNRQAFADLDGRWVDGIQTAAALAAAVTGIDTASQDATASAGFWGQAVADSGGDAELAAKRTEELEQALRDYVTETGHVPTKIVSDIQANIDQGSLNRAEEQLEILTRNRKMSVSIEAAGGTGFVISGGQGGTGPRSVNPDAPPVINVTQHLPRGWRGDALGEARRVARRSGGLYRRVS